MVAPSGVPWSEIAVHFPEAGAARGGLHALISALGLVA
jgi:hypothetical protein